MRNVLLTLVAACSIFAETPVEKAWATLKGAIDDKGTEKRVHAVAALGLIPNNKHAETLAITALKDEKPEVRATAATALGQMKAKSAAGNLKEAIKDKDVAVVFGAAQALYEIGDPAAYEVYYAVLTGERKSGEGLVESQLKMIHDPKAMTMLGVEAGIGFIPFGGLGYHVFKMVTKDDESPVRAAAALKLVRDADPKSTEGLENSINDSKWLVRAAVIEAAAKRRDKKLLKPVIAAMDDENDSVRFSAAAATIVLSARESVPKSKKSASSPPTR